LTTPFDINEKYAAQLVLGSTHAQVENHFYLRKTTIHSIPAPDSLAFYGTG
jgi:hypothetical protein